MVQPPGIVLITIPVIGNSAVQGTAFQIHIAVVSFILGASILGVLYESIGVRGSALHERFAHGLAHGITGLFAWGTTWAVFALVFLFGLYPGLISVLVRIFFWPFVVIIVLWAIFTVLAYVYYYTWNRLSNRRPLHIAIGATYAAAQFAFLVLVTSLSSYQLTPRNPLSLSAALLNPTWIPEWSHRLVAVLGYTGFIVAGFAVYRLLGRTREEDRRFYGWVEHQGVLWGVILLLLQPLASGWVYVSSVKDGSPGAFEIMMVGQNAWFFLVQIGLLFALFLSANVFMWRSMVRSGVNGRAVGLVRWSIVAFVVFWVIADIPKELPLGSMFPWKALSLAILVLTTVFILVVYLRSRRLLSWGSGMGLSEYAVLAATALSLGMIIIMGVIRESARGGQLIYGVLK